MSDASDVKLLTVNAKTQFNTSAAIDRVKIHNDSSMYLRVYFGADAPQQATDPGWHDTIGPGSSPLVAVVGASASVFSDRTNYVQSTPYLGVITVMPFLPVGAPTPTGIISGAAFCFIVSYYPNEVAEAGGQVEAFVQAAKQGRYQAVIGAALNTGGIGFLTDETTTDNTVMTTMANSITTSNAPALFAANAAGSSPVNSYLMYYSATMRSRSPAVSSCYFVLNLGVTTNTFTVRTSNSLLVVFLTCAGGGTDRFVWTPTYPVVARTFIGQNVLTSGDFVAPIYRNFTGTGGLPSPAVNGQFEIYHHCHFMIDVQNQSPDLAFNTSAISNQFPWNATYNPQTY